MRDAARCHWQRWRVALAAQRPATDPAPGRFVRRPLTDDAAGLEGAEPVAAECPAADGIRHDLVARVRREIEAGTYESEERWAAAEDLLLRRVAGGR